MNKEEDFNRQVDKILPKQKPKDTRNYFQRNKKLLIIIGLVLLVLYIGTSIYVHYAFKNISKQINSLSE